ncbi:MAG: 16S rRNA (guanine(966)-N(2))-methyltransferase RsmD [Myxococcaceae bacterium]|nr:16S rRNA (guanine(966)-N(2))-methyltransferase RsmD [Myxococcaceae bacterium]MBH2006419.1 16S rRNA (guanine(966)-N(2))-methyltransferase RsmD [Myxococcaceae bacterium]
MAGFLRITGGAWVRKRFRVPEEADQKLVRPASDRVREAVFSALGSRIAQARILDLFSGSGAYVFESLSRGAKEAVLLEKSSKTHRCIQSNLEHLRCEPQCRLILGDSMDWVVQERLSGLYDIVFVDPPYGLKLPTDYWPKLSRLLSEDALVVFRCRSQREFETPSGYEVIREKTYGGTWVSFLRWESN